MVFPTQVLRGAASASDGETASCQVFRRGRKDQAYHCPGGSGADDRHLAAVLPHHVLDDRQAQAEYKAARVAQKPYVYQTQS